MGARSHLWHCLSVPLGSRYVAMIRDMPMPGDVDSSSIPSHGLCCIIVYLCGFGFGFWLSVRALLGSDFVPGKTEELIHILVPQQKD